MDASKCLDVDGCGALGCSTVASWAIRRDKVIEQQAEFLLSHLLTKQSGFAFSFTHYISK